MTCINELPIVIYLANMHTSEWCTQAVQRMSRAQAHVNENVSGELINTHADRDGRSKPKRRFSVRESNNRGTRTYVAHFWAWLAILSL